METKDQLIESSSSQPHSEADTEEVEGDDEGEERAPSEKADTVSHTTNDVKIPKTKKVFIVPILDPSLTIVLLKFYVDSFCRKPA